MNVKTKLDPLLSEVNRICKSLVGVKVHQVMMVTFPHNDAPTIIENNNNKLNGNMIEKLVFHQLSEKMGDKFRQGEKNSPPDFYLGEFEYEIKAYGKSPGFDVANYSSYIDQLCENLERKLLMTKYIIFNYSCFSDESFVINNFQIVPIWKLLNYKNKYPISVQVKRGSWYNIRPDTCPKRWTCDSKTITLFIKQILLSIESCSLCKDREEKIEKIKKQYEILLSKYTI